MRFLISGHIQAQGFGLEPEPIKLVVEAASMERACKVSREIYPNLQLEQARIATIFEGYMPLFEGCMPRFEGCAPLFEVAKA